MQVEQGPCGKKACMHMNINLELGMAELKGRCHLVQCSCLRLQRRPLQIPTAEQKKITTSRLQIGSSLNNSCAKLLSQRAGSCVVAVVYIKESDYQLSKSFRYCSRGFLQPPHCTCQSSRLPKMFPLPWRQTPPWFRLSVKIFTLSPFSRFMYNVNEPAEVFKLCSECFVTVDIRCTFGMWWCLTRIYSSHLIPKRDTLCLGGAKVNRGS